MLIFLFPSNDRLTGTNSIKEVQKRPATESETESVEEFLSWLSSVGLIFHDEGLDKEARHMDVHFVRLHPLLPYLLRYALETLLQDKPGILHCYRTFQRLFWVFYETRLSRVTGNRAYQNARCTAYARDIENIMNAMLISMEQGAFGERVVFTIEAILFHPEIQSLLSQRQTRRLYRVVIDCSIRYDMMSKDIMPKDVLEQAFRIIQFIDVHPSEKRPPDHAHPNIERGERLLQVIQRRFPNEDFTVACEMWCKVHELIARGPLTAGHYDEVRGLVLKSAPSDDQFWKDVFTSSQTQMVIFVARELPSAAFAVEPFEALIAQFTKKHETTFLNSFGDPQLCSSAISLYTASITLGDRSDAIARALNDLAGSKVMDMFPEARRYLASAYIPGMEPRKELCVLENALEISLEHHDKVTEFFVRDGLFSMRADEDRKAAVQHYERLHALEHEFQATSFEPSSRGRIGVRHLGAGTLYLSLSNESNSQQLDLESKARDCFKESLRYLERLPGFGEEKYYANYYLSTFYRKAGMHKESLQHAVAIVQLERSQEKENLPQPRNSFEKGEFLWHYGKIWKSLAVEGLGSEAIQLDLERGVASRIGWYSGYLRELMLLCLKAIQHYRWYEYDCYDGSWATCSGPFKKFLWGAQELLFASNALLAQQVIWPVSSEGRSSSDQLTAWLDCVAEGPAEDVLNRLQELVIQWHRMTSEENRGGA